MRKKTHNLRPNSRQTFPRHVIFYDNESTQTEDSQGELTHYLMFGVAQYVDYQAKNVEEECVYRTAAEFWDWAVSKTVNQRTLYIIAHNQDFDFRLVRGFSNLQQRGFHSHKHILEYPRCICTFGTWKKVHGKLVKPEGSHVDIPRKYIQCLDTLNWFKETLAQLGETVGVPKLEFPGYDAEFNEWLKYCRQDVIVLRRVFERYIEFLKKYKLGTFGPTIAAQSLNAFKTRFLEKPIEIHTYEKATNIERRAYFGGRTDCLYIGKLPCGLYYKVDINSMYPYVMRDNLYPTKLVGTTICDDPTQVAHWRKNFLCIADVTLTTTQPAFPYRHNNKLLFPTGTFTTGLCAPELALLDAMNCEYTIHQMAVYEGAPVFEKFINELYTMRQNFRASGDDQYQYFTKILMNSLYGKFGQRNESWEYVGDDGTKESGVETLVDGETGEDVKIKKVVGEIFKCVGLEEGFDSMTAISAFVTSYARILLWRLLTIAGANHSYYMDTDSLIVDAEGLKRLKKHIDELRLGALKVESFDSSGQIWNVKDYRFAKELHIKGVSRKAEYLGENRYLVEQWEHFNGAVLRNRTETVITKKIEKILKREYEKGDVLASGRTSPFVF